MPELPEVETITNGIKEVLDGGLITGITYYRDNLRDEIPKKQLNRILINEVILNIYRRSKYILIETKRGTCLIHLGMTGNVLYYDDAKPQLTHTHVIFEFKRKSQKKAYLHYVDPRRFGRFACSEGDINEHVLIKHLGPEPLECRQLAKHLYELSRNRKTPVKSFIMDAHNVVGVGNIYASESLFASHISPLRHANQVSLDEYRLLAKEIKKTLKKAIKSGGTTLKDFKSTKGDPGYFAISLNVYGRQTKPCFKCGNPIESVKIGGRSSFFCPNCQQ